MKDTKKKYKKQIITEDFEEADYEYQQDRQPIERGTNTKPIVLQHMVEAFDNFRIGMDKLANSYTLMNELDPELHRKVGRFGEAMTKMINGLATLIEQQGGSVESVTKSKGLQKYFGTQGMSALGLNENKRQAFEDKVDLNVNRIKNIMNNSKR